jgi:hypothetical protein
MAQGVLCFWGLQSLNLWWGWVFFFFVCNTFLERFSSIDFQMDNFSFRGFHGKWVALLVGFGS